MAWLRAALAFLAAAAVGAVLVSGGSSADPRTPAALPGLAPPFLGTAVVGSGGLTAAIDAYGDVVDLRAGPVDEAVVAVPFERQAAGTVSADTGIVPRLSLDGGRAMPFWRAGSVRQHYRPGTNVLVTEARWGPARVEVVYAARGGVLACLVRSTGGGRTSLESEDAARSRLRCNSQMAREIIRTAARSDRRWLARALPLGRGAPGWAVHMYQRSLLTLRALTDRRTGVVAAGARDGWAYVWPRDAGAVALALATAGYRPEARRVARFLLGLDLDAAARFHGDGTPVEEREAQGDAAGWVAVAARATGLPSTVEPLPWRHRPDYQERAPGDYLANALAASAVEPPADGPISHAYRGSSAHRRKVMEAFAGSRGLMRVAGGPDSGLDSAAAWAVRPFPQPALLPAARRTLLRLAGEQGRYGFVPSDDWDGVDPWTAPTAWSAWGLAVLASRALRARDDAAERHERREALRLLGALRRAAAPTGALPERVDALTGTPRSTTPLAWSHAFAVLALRELWPRGTRRSSFHRHMPGKGRTPPTRSRTVPPLRPPRPSRQG